jgi:hypothetical protein
LAGLTDISGISRIAILGLRGSYHGIRAAHRWLMP